MPHNEVSEAKPLNRINRSYKMNVQTLRAQYVADFRANAAEYDDQRKALSNVLLGQGFVVVTSGNIPLRFDIDANRTVTNPLPTNTANATRFRQEDAETIAKNVTNGLGEKAEAMHIVHLLTIKAAQARECADQIEALIKKEVK